MSKRMMVAVTVCMALLIAGAAKAGYRAPHMGVRISHFSDGGIGGSGTFANARADANPKAQIRCFSYPTSAYCIATSDGTSANYVACSTTDPSLINIIRSVNPDSYISFIGDAGATCTSVLVANDSAYAPKLN